MMSRLLGRPGAGPAAARHAMLALSLAAASMLLADSVSGQDVPPSQGTQEDVAAEKPIDPFAAGAFERTRDLPSAPPAAAPVKPWEGKFLPDGQPELAKGVWRASQGATRYIDSPQPGFLKASRVVDPPDGKIPYLPWAREVKKLADYYLDNPTQPWHVDTQARCVSTVPRMHHYVTGYVIYQIPGFVVFNFELEHLFRVIPLDGAPHIGRDIKLWMGDARGHWEGNTLIVDTGNLNATAKMSSSGDFMSPNAHLAERFSFVDADSMTYEVTIDDPTVFARPWTMRVDHKRGQEFAPIDREPPAGEFVEYMCYEGQTIQGVPSEIPGTEIPEYAKEAVR